MSDINHTLCIYSSNAPGILHRVTVIFTRRKLNIESLTVSETGTHGISRFTIVIRGDGDTADKVARQVRRIEDVYEVFVCKDDEIIHREIALFKLKRTPEGLRALKELGDQGLSLRTLDEQEDYLVVEQTGAEEEIEDTLKKMADFGVREFVRSGRIGIRRNGATLKEVLEEHEQRQEPLPESWI